MLVTSGNKSALLTGRSRAHAQWRGAAGFSIAKEGQSHIMRLGKVVQGSPRETSVCQSMRR
eukprot:285447-Karenia_brevis.AAC.1